MPGGGSAIHYRAPGEEFYRTNPDTGKAELWIASGYGNSVLAPENKQPGYKSEMEKLQEQLLMEQINATRGTSTGGGYPTKDIATPPIGGSTGTQTGGTPTGGGYAPVSSQIVSAMSPIVSQIGKTGDDKYYEAKFAQLQGAGLIGKPYEGMPLNNIQDLKNIFSSLNLTPASHYAQYGKSEGLSDPTAYVSTGATATAMPTATPDASIYSSAAPNPFVTPGQSLAESTNPFQVGGAVQYDTLAKSIAKEQQALGGQTQDYLSAFKGATQWTPETRDSYMKALEGTYAGEANEARVSGGEALSDRGIVGGGSYGRMADQLAREKQNKISQALGETYKPSGIAPSYEPYLNLAATQSRDASAETILPMLSSLGQLSIWEAMNPQLYQQPGKGTATTGFTTKTMGYK